MARLVARYAALVAALVILNFLLPRLLPGDPLDALTGGDLSGAAAPLPVEARARLRDAYRLDQPLGAQFVGYLDDLAHADLGWSISKSAAVRELIGERVPWTLGLVLGAMVLAATGGVLLGVWTTWRGGRAERLAGAVAAGLAALPEFLVGMLLLLALSVGLGWFPLQGGRSPFGNRGPLDVAWHLALPALTLVVATLAGFVLLAGGAMRGVLAEPYLLVARGKGLSDRRVALGHALPNALLPILTLFGVRVGQVLGGALVVERLFGVPGLGLLAFEALRARDYPVLQAVFLLSSLGVLLASFAVEVVYHALAGRHAR
jgi:peptide/nickel transport system permease protein